MGIKEAIKTLQNGTVLVGHVADILEVEGVFNRKDIKTVLDALGSVDMKQRHFIYEQMELRR